MIMGIDLSLTVGEQLSKFIKKHPKKTAVIYLGTRYSYEKLGRLVNNFAASLCEHGLKDGARVIMFMPNSVQFIISWLGILKAGAVVVPISPIYTAHDLEFIANDTEAVGIACMDRNFGYVKQIADKTKIRKIIVSRLTDILPQWKRIVGWTFGTVPRGSFARDVNISHFRDMAYKHAPEEVRKEISEPAQILYTGGTTKAPKGVPITYKNIMLSVEPILANVDPLFPKEEDVIMTGAPLFHILGQGAISTLLTSGGTLIVSPRVNLDAIFQYIQDFKAKSFYGVPAIYRMILEHDRVDRYDLSSLKYSFSGGDVLPVETGRRWKEKFNFPITQGYGATETCGAVFVCPAGVDNPPDSIGRVVPNVAVKVINSDSHEEVATGQPGELVVTSPHMVKGYLNKPEETASAFIELDDGRTWYRTGDIIRIDGDGYAYFVDRTADIIKHKGYRVSGSEIESVLQNHDAIISACVVGVPDEKVGERIKAYVVLKSDVRGITGYDLIKWCRSSLSSYKVPQYIEFRDMLPKSKVGKFLKRDLRSDTRRMAEL